MENAEDFFISRQNGDRKVMVLFGDGICGRFFISAQQGILKEMVVPKKAEFFFVPAGEQF